jgi:hypothetical protein
MKILSYILIALVATVPGLWIKEYVFTNPVWWTVVLAYFFGNLLGYFEGLHKKKKERKTDEE